MTLANALKNVIQGALVIKGTGNTETVQADGTDIFLTAIVTGYGVTNPSVDLAGSGEPVSGVIIEEQYPYAVDLDKDSDDCFDDDQWLGMYVPESGDLLYLTVATASSIAKDNWFKASGGFIVTSDKADALGTCLEAITGVSGTEQVTLCRWGVDA